MDKPIGDYMELHGIIIKGYGNRLTQPSLDFVKENLKHLGNLKYIICAHGRTNIIGANGKIILTGVGFGREVGGTGFAGFTEVLKMLEISEDEFRKNSKRIKENPFDEDDYSDNLGRFIFCLE